MKNLYWPNICAPIKHCTLAISLLIILWGGSIRAEETSCQGDCVPIGQWQISVSLGLGMRTNPVIGQDDTPFIIVPRISYYGKRFFLDSYDLGYTLIDKQAHQFSAILISPGFEQAFFNDWSIRNFDLGGSSFAGGPTQGIDGSGKDPDAPQDGSDPITEAPDPEEELEPINLHKRRTAGLSGFEYTYIHPYFDWQTQILQDVTHIHDGQKIRSAITVPWVKNKNYWALSAGATWQSQELVDYYYGVTEDEVYDSAKVYTATSSKAFYIKAEWERPLSKHWGLRALTSYKWLGSGVTDSPIIEEDGVFTVFAAGVYHF